MEARNLPQALKLIMQERGWSQTDLARELGVSQPWVSQVTRGVKQTTTSKAIMLLASVGWELVIRPKREESDPVKRREFVVAAASVAFVPSGTDDPYQSAQYVRALAERSARVRDEVGGVPVVSLALRQVRRIEPLVKSGNRDLQAAASELARRTAETLYDARRHNAAMHIGGLCLTLAKKSQDVDSQARAYITMSNMCQIQGRSDLGAKFAADGLQLRDVAPSELASLNARMACSLALIPGQQSATRKALDQAQEIEGLSPAYLAAIQGCVGVSLYRLRAYGEADDYLDRAVMLHQPLSPLYQALYLGHQSTAALRASDPPKAAEHMRALSHAASLVTSSRVDETVARILTASERWNALPEVRDARERLLALA